MSRDGCLGALLLLGQLGPDLMGELVQVLLHTLHAEPLGVEKAAVLTGGGERKKRSCIKTLCFTFIYMHVRNQINYHKFTLDFSW